mmetsp:Transcript_23756/g.68387  ORF Transcript_23756/g.68387 Transcript_23756/m.68387 type:complete len:658 (+) Transcript_23756:104-2077(+)
MSGGFRDTFTKEDSNEGLLGYDDAAFYYFAGSLMLTIAVPWTYNFIKGTIFPSTQQNDVPKKLKSGSLVVTCKASTMMNKMDKPSSQRFGLCWKIQLGVLILMWVLLGGIYVLVGSAQKEINRFDPFEILEVSTSASAGDIKKAYRKLSLVYHPDKNPDDPLAASRFIQITKAYAALTDESAKRNYEKYGNPDGPQTTKVGIGLPRFLLEKNNQLLILCAFFFMLIFAVPMTFICYYQRTKNYAPNGVMIETLQFLGYYINESTRMKNCPELVAASAESRAMLARPTDNNAMKPIAQEVVEHKTRQFTNHPIIMKNSFLIWGHMQRLHHLMTPELREDLDALLKDSVKITQAMIEIACMREWFFTAQAMIEFRRNLIQALDIKGPQLLQVPYYTEDILKQFGKGKNACSTLVDFMSRDAESRKGLVEMEPQQVADIEAFCAHVSDMEIFTKVLVEDENEIVVGDIATVIIQLHRKNLREGEAAGPVHAPLFPGVKYEEWWVFLVEGNPGTRILASERLRDTERVIEAKLRFQVSRPGKYRMEVHALCDSYSGLDKKVEINFTAFSQDEVKREIFIHKEDEDLDLQPTLFQQLMGDFGQDEESEEEEEQESESKKPAKSGKKDGAAKDGGKELITEEGAKGDGDGGDSSESSSESDSD